MAKRKERNKKRAPAKSRCRDCGAEQTVPRHDYFKASRPRCMACGGLLEYLGGWDGTRSSVPKPPTPPKPW